MRLVESISRINLAVVCHALREFNQWATTKDTKQTKEAHSESAFADERHQLRDWAARRCSREASSQLDVCHFVGDFIRQEIYRLKMQIIDQLTNADSPMVSRDHVGEGDSGHLSLQGDQQHVGDLR